MSTNATLNALEVQLSTVLSNLEEAETLEFLTIGTTMALLSLLCFGLNLLVLRIILRDKDLRRLNSYKFMFALGVADCLQLVVHFITGFFTVWQSTVHPLLNELLGAIVTPSYVFYAVLTIVLAVNRLVTISSISWDNLLFSAKGMKYWFYGSSFISLCFTMALITPWASILYNPDQLSWAYDDQLEWSYRVQQCEMFIEIGGIFVSGLLYAAIFGLILHKKKFLEHKNAISVKANQPNVLMVEFKVLIQAVVITAYCTALNFLWHNSEKLLPHTKIVYCALNFMWIGNGAVNPLIYFAVNVAIRQRVVSTFAPGATRQHPAPIQNQNRQTVIIRMEPMKNNFINGNSIENEVSNCVVPKSA